MPNKKSAKKELRKNIKRNAHNAGVKSKIKTLRKKVLALIAEKKIDEAKKAFALFQKAMDKAAKNNLYAKNTASRYKSLLAKKLKQ